MSATHAARRHHFMGIHVFRGRKHAANAGRLREREHQADARRGPRRALPRPAFQPVHMARRMAPSKQAAASKAYSTGAQARAAVGGGDRRRDRAAGAHTVMHSQPTVCTSSV